MPTVAELIDALPDHTTSSDSAGSHLTPESTSPLPLGRFRRAGLLATLQAKIAAAYLFYFLRGFFTRAPKREQLLAQTHWRTAARLLDSMTYLRGAVMKVGQTLGNFPDIVPDQFVDTLQQLHFQAPPMHWPLLREMVFNELGDDPEHLFASFDTRAFAAASLGQVHRARTTSGHDVAVKIQYPGIGRTVADDFRNLSLALLPARLFKDWENTRAQFDDLQSRIQQETDYRREAATQTRVASLFRPEDGIVIPRVHPDLSTDRVLTMDYLPGLHLDDFLATDPPQHVRDAFARKIVVAWYRMLFAGRTLYADNHPGNFLFMNDGRLGVLDFGCMVDIDDGLWDLLRKMDRPLTTGRADERRAVLKEWCDIGDDPADADRLRVTDEYTDWSWRARYTPGPFDFSDRADFQHGIDLFTEMVRKRYSRAEPSTPIIARQYLGLRSLLYRLRANIEIAPLAEQEVPATGWDRSGYT